MAQQPPQPWTDRPELDTNYDLVGHRTQNVTCLSAHGSKVLAGGADGRVALFDLEQRNKPLIATTPRDSTGHDRAVVGCGWFHDGGVFVSACCAGNVVVWDASTTQAACRFDLKQALASAALAPLSTGPTAAICAAGTGDGSARLCDARSGACHATLTHGHGAVAALAWHPTNGTLLTAGADGAAHLWDVRTLKKRGSLDRCDLSGAPASINDHVAKTAHDGGLRLAVFSSTVLLTAGADERLRAWDSTTGAFASDAFAPLQIKRTRSPAPLQSVFLAAGALVPDGRNASLVSLESANEAWRTPDAGHAGDVRACAFSSAVNRVVSCDDRGGLVVWRPPVAVEPADEGEDAPQIRVDVALAAADDDDDDDFDSLRREFEEARRAAAEDRRRERERPAVEEEPRRRRRRFERAGEVVRRATDRDVA